MKNNLGLIRANARFVSLSLILLTMLFSTLIKQPVKANTAVLKYTVAASGVFVSNGRDTVNKFTFDNNIIQNAYVLDPLPAELQNVYPTIPETKWISISADGGHYGNNGRATVYRADFSMPLSGLPRTAKIRLHADNVATVSVNGFFVGAQPNCNCYENFDNPETQFSIPISFLRQNFNTLQIEVYNYDSYTALDYKVVVEY